MKLKYYLRGLGIGIILTTIVLMVEFNVRGNEMSDDQIIERAQDLGMVMAENESNGASQTLADISKKDEDASDEEESTSSANADTTVTSGDDAVEKDTSDTEAVSEDTETGSEDTASASTEEKEKGSDKAAAADTQDAGEETSVAEKDVAADTAATDTTAEDSAAQAGDTTVTEVVEVAITPGEYSDAVAQKLFERGLVDDASAFNAYITDNNYDNALQPGTFSIPKGSSYEEIAKILTK